MAKKKSLLFKDITLTWWQAGLFKSAAVSFGILLALYFENFFRPLLPLFWLTFLIPGCYIVSLYIKKK